MTSDESREVEVRVPEDEVGVLLGDLDLVQKAADVGLNYDEETPRRINSRHVVSHKLPVPQEVDYYDYKLS